MLPDWIYVVMGNAAMVLNLASFWMVDVRKLRMVAIASSLCFIAYSMIVPGGPLWIMVAWSVVFLSVNAYRLRTSPITSPDPKCVCYGNWRELVGEVDGLVGREFIDWRGTVHIFFGLVDGEDDYYYGMFERDTGRVHLLSCVGNLDGHGFSLVPHTQVWAARQRNRYAALT